MRELLLANFDEAYDKRGWHGTNLRGSLRGVHAKEAFARPAPGRHNIYELTVHAAYWKSIARRRLTGDRRARFPMKGSNWIAAPVEDEATWREAVALLDREHRALREVIASATDAMLGDAKKLRMMYGVAAHDLYHAGQIQLVKRLVRA
ncbi:MAG TPA: DinB family protein [Thermoanaerobaculia bacterium]|jgi:hypothetical protein